MDRLDCDRMFVAVMEAGSFVGAAQRLCTSSGQASKLVSRLESELGVRLPNRTTRAISPTEAGQAYYMRLQPLLVEFDDLDSTIRNISATPRGRLRLTAPLTFGTLEIAPALNDFAAQFPDIELEFSFSDRVVSLVDEGFDMAVRVGRPDDSSLIARRICDVRIVLVAAPTYLERHGEPTSPTDVAQHECIIDTNRPRLRSPQARFRVGIEGMPTSPPPMLGCPSWMESPAARPEILRVSMGILFLAHASLKLFVFTPAGTAGYFASLGLPGTLAYLVIAAELFGGIALILGVYSRWVSLALVPILFGSIYAPHGAAGFFFSNEGGGWEFPAFWAVALVVQALLDDGAFALKRVRA